MKLVQVDDVPIPDWLLEAAFCQPNKAYISERTIQDFAWDVLLPLARRHPDVNISLRPCSNHVHIGDVGLTPHNHLPHAFTSVLYLEDSMGELVLNPDTAEERMINPIKGRFVMFAGDIMHSVNPSPCPELRISLVTNYEYPSV